jgi:molybdenum cofactor cytidylyltransferase
VKIGGVILAAGLSTRMRGHRKALLDWERGNFFDHTMYVFDLPVDPVVVVIREGDEQTSGSYMAKYCRFVVNPDPDRGQLSSLQVGLAELPDAKAIAFCPVDFPAVEPKTMKLLVKELDASDALIIQPRFETRHGHPVIIRRPVIDAVLAAPSTATTRDVLRQFAAQTRYVAVDDPGVVADIDTPDDYRAMLQKFAIKR